MSTPRLGITYVTESQAQKATTVDAAFDVLDAAVTRVTGDTMTGGLKITRTAVTVGNPAADFWLVAPADTGLTASIEAVDVLHDLSAVRQFATGALTNQRAMRILAPTYGFVGASTITTAATVSISGAPTAGTNATITNSYALNVENGSSNFGGTINVTPTVTARCLTLNHKNASGATVFLTSNNATDGTWRTLINFGSKFQFGTDSTFSGTADWFMQNQSTGNLVLGCTAADLVTIGSTAAAGGAVLGASGGKVALYGATPIVQQAQTVDLKAALVNIGFYAAGAGATPLDLGGGALKAGVVTFTGHVLGTGGTTPTAAAGAQAGTTPPAPVLAADSTDTRGKVTFGTGTGATAGAMCRITFANAYASTPYVFVQGVDATIASTLGLTIANRSSTLFDIWFMGIPASGQANTTFAVFYHVLG